MSVAVNPAANRIFQEFNTTLMKALAEAPKVHTAYSFEVPSSSRSTLLAWILNSVAVREWKGSRSENDWGSLVWEIVNRDWEVSWKFHENQIRDDLSGLVAQALQAARTQAFLWAEHEDRLCTETLQAGVSKACYDGQNFFSTTHPIDPTGIVAGTFSNYNTNKPLNFANLKAVLEQFLGFKKPNGAPMVLPGAPINLVVEASNWTIAKQLAESEWMTPSAAFGVFGAGGASQNILRGMVKPVLNQYANNEAGVWNLTAEYAGMKPVVLQRRQGVETQELGPGSEPYYRAKEYHIGQDARYEASYAHPQLAIRNEPT